LIRDHSHGFVFRSYHKESPKKAWSDFQDDNARNEARDGLFVFDEIKHNAIWLMEVLAQLTRRTKNIK